MAGEFICPTPGYWTLLYRRLRNEWHERGDGSIPEPPSGLVLSGWVWTGEAERRAAWRDFVQWGEDYGFSHSIPAPDDIPEQARQHGS